MSFPIGISAERGTVTRRFGRIGTAVALVAAFAALLFRTQFHTIDPRGFARWRTAAFVWGFVPAHPWWVTLAFGVTVAGAFALLWLSVLVDAGANEASTVPIVDAPEVARVDPEWQAGRWMWTLCAIALAAFAAWRMGLFAHWRAFGVFDTFASFDHPFHVARAETLVRSLLHGESLRWVANHQGGYPAEFYPFGWASVEAALWMIGFGRVPMPIVHRVAIVLLFVAPAVVFFVMAARDRWPAVVGLAAFAMHVAVPGEMWSGGYSELVYVGLAPSVSAALAVLVSVAAAANACATRSRRAAALAGIAAAAAIWCNPRGGIAVAVCVGATWVSAVRWRDWHAQTRQVLIAAVVAALLAAPEVLSLVRFGRLYFFIRYTDYASALDYLASSIEAVSVPVATLAAVGVLGAFRMPRERFVTRAVAYALVAYVAVTAILSFGVPTAISQLETTRLMPVQRLLTIYLAGVGLHILALRLPAPRAVQAAAIAALLVAYVGPARLMPFWSRGLYPVHRTGTPAFDFLQEMLTAANDAAPPGTAILVAGTPNEDRPQLWAPVRLDRLFFYDDWMWYWQARHRGPYDPTRTSKYDPNRLGEVFARPYLERNAIGAVVAAPAAQQFADRSAALSREFAGTYGLYRVVNPVPVVTFAGRAPDALVIENHRIRASGTSDGGVALIRRNWFPRWRAEVNGRPSPISQTDDGYMTVQVPPGRVDVTLRYALDSIDVAARGCMVLGLLAVAMLLKSR